MRINQHAQHAQCLVVLDKSHAAHIGRQIEYSCGSLNRLFAGRYPLEIDGQAVDSGRCLVPLLDGFGVDSSHDLDPVLGQATEQMAANEASCTTHNNAFVS